MESRAIEDRADIVLLILRLSTTSNIHTNGCSSCFTPSDGLDSHRWRDTVWVEKYIVPVGQISKKNCSPCGSVRVRSRLRVSASFQNNASLVGRLYTDGQDPASWPTGPMLCWPTGSIDPVSRIRCSVYLDYTHVTIIMGCKHKFCKKRNLSF